MLFDLGLTLVGLRRGLRESNATAAVVMARLGQAGGAASQIRFPSGSAGIIVNRHTSLGYDELAVSTTAADGAIIEGLKLVGGTEGIVGGGATYDAAAEADGILLRARATIRDCQVTAFRRSGIAILAGSDGNPMLGNANNWRIDAVRLTYNGEHGLYVEGTDTNAGVAILVDSENNRTDGIRDSSFLGNTYVQCHASGNARAYASTNDNARCVFIGCYSESGQTASTFSQLSLVLGGLHEAGVSAGAYISGSGGWVSISNLIISGTISVAGNSVTNSIVALGPTAGTVFQSDYYLNTTATTNTIYLRSHDGGAQTDAQIVSARGTGLSLLGASTGAAIILKPNGTDTVVTLNADGLAFASGKTINFGSITNAVDDAAAATAGVSVGSVYRNGSVLMVRVS